MKTLVSIVTPSYNQARYLEQTILSVQNQTYRPIEHIIIDGGSTDETIAILKKHESNSVDIQLKWISEKDRGQGHAVNKGLKLTRGEIIGWINSDDVYFSKDVVECVVRQFTENPDVDIIHGDVAKIGENNLIHFIWCIPEFDYDRMYVDGKVSQPTVFFRSRVFAQHSIREDLLALDYELWLRLGKTFKFKHINSILAGDREQPNRISVVKREELRKSHVRVRDEYFHAPSPLRLTEYRLSSFLIRFLYRLKGLIRLVVLMADSKLSEKLAFEGFIDQTARAVYWQIFRRVGKL